MIFSLFKKKKKFKPIKTTHSYFDPDQWISAHKSIRVDTTDMMRLERRI